MTSLTSVARRVLSSVFLTWCFSLPVVAAERMVLPGHVPALVRRAHPLGRLGATNELSLAVGLPLRDKPTLTALLRELYDPLSPNYRQFLTCEEFTRRFGPVGER